MREHRLGIAFAIMVMVCAGSATTHAAVDFTPASLTTPDTDVGVASGSVSGTLTENDSGNPKFDLAVGSCSGAGAGTFNISPNNSVNPTATITITYTPSAAGPRTCTVNIYDENTTNIRKTFTVAGNGQDPPMISVGSISAFTAVRVFDNAVAPHTSTRTITVTNSGDRQLQINSVTITGDFSLDPSSTTGLGMTTLAGGTSRQWTILFNPSAVGTRTGSITFNSNAGNPSTALTGDGTSGAMSTSIQSNGAFGTVGGGSTAGLDITLAPTGGNPRGTITIKSAAVTPDDATKAWFALSGVPATLTSSNATVTVTCSPPANNTMSATGVVTFVADVDGSPGPNYETTFTHNVSCTAGASLLSLSTASVDFGSHLVGPSMTTASQIFTLTNAPTATNTANVRFSTTSANEIYFTLATPGQCGIGGNADCPIPVGGSIDLNVQFKSRIEGTVTAGYTITSGGPSLGFTLTGRGVDRHLELTETMYSVADTFRNPGSKATITDVPLRNAGEYPILVSEVVVDGEPVWSVVEPVAPFMIGGLETVNLKVAFAPLAAGKADDGQVLILNDDAKFMNGMPRLIMSGNGKDRNVDLTPGAIDVGDTFAGIQARHSLLKPDEMLLVVNSEVADSPDNNFPIREILVKDIDGKETDVFQVVNRSTGDKLDGFMLNAESNVEVDVIFTPTYPGDFEAFIEVYLDEDPVPQTPIPVRGRALYVDAHGSGGFGCSTGHGSRGAMLLIVGALALVLGRRRR